MNGYDRQVMLRAPCSQVTAPTGRSLAHGMETNRVLVQSSNAHATASLCVDRVKSTSGASAADSATACARKLIMCACGLQAFWAGKALDSHKRWHEPRRCPCVAACSALHVPHLPSAAVLNV